MADPVQRLTVAYGGRIFSEFTAAELLGRGIPTAIVDAAVAAAAVPPPNTAQAAAILASSKATLATTAAAAAIAAADRAETAGVSGVLRRETAAELAAIEDPDEGATVEVWDDGLLTGTWRWLSGAWVQTSSETIPSVAAKAAAALDAVADIRRPGPDLFDPDGDVWDRVEVGTDGRVAAGYKGGSRFLDYDGEIRRVGALTPVPEGTLVARRIGPDVFSPDGDAYDLARVGLDGRIIDADRGVDRFVTSDGAVRRLTAALSSPEGMIRIPDMFGPSGEAFDVVTVGASGFALSAEVGIDLYRSVGGRVVLVGSASAAGTGAAPAYATNANTASPNYGWSAET